MGKGNGRKREIVDWLIRMDELISKLINKFSNQAHNHRATNQQGFSSSSSPG